MPVTGWLAPNSNSESARILRGRLEILARQQKAPEYAYNEPGALFVRRVPTDSPIYAVCEVINAGGGMRDLYTGSLRELVAYVSGRINW